MELTVTSKRQVTFPVHVLAQLGARAGDKIELMPSDLGFVLRTKRIDTSKLASLRGRISAQVPAFDLEQFRTARHAPNLRD